MNSLKKLLALVLVLVMALTVFTACGKEDENTENSIAGLYINGEMVLDSDDIFMTINGYEVPFDEYRYMYMYLDLNYFSQGDSSYWVSYPEDFAYLNNVTASYVLEANWGNLLAQEYGITLTEEDLATVDSYMNEQIAYFESEEAFEAALVESGMSRDLLRRLLQQEIMCNRVYEDLYATEGAPLAPSDEEIRQTLLNDYVRTQHLLISFDHFEDLEGYEEYTEEELKAAALELATNCLELINNGTATIYDLAQEIGDDPGMLDNEEGYLFTYDEMVEEFEEASFALEVGQISGIVETTYGYHIIQRLEHELYIVANSDECRELVINAKFNSDVDELLANAEVIYNENYDLMTSDSIQY